MSDPPLRLLRDGARVDLVLSRPAGRNALNPALRLALKAVLDDLVADATLPALVVLRAEGPVFCAGADLKERPASAAWSWEERWQEHRAWAETLRLLQHLPCITVAQVEGPAIGGGGLLALSCDIRVGGRDAAFQFPEAAFGLPLPWDGPKILSRLAGADWSREVVLTGRRVGAEEAQRKGLLHQLAAGKDAGELTALLAIQLAKTPVRVLRAVKAAFGPPEEYGQAWVQADVLASAVESAG